jgi:general secretion pathway protein G
MRSQNRHSGFTLIELIITVTIIAVLVGMAVPLTRNAVKREREIELRRALHEMREAIDKYKEMADRGQIQITLNSEGYPAKLEDLVEGVPVVGGVDKKLKLLRRVPVDPMTNSTEWGMRSYQDDPKSMSWGGQNVFDVYTKSDGVALDGTKYNEW